MEAVVPSRSPYLEKLENLREYSPISAVALAILAGVSGWTIYSLALPPVTFALPVLFLVGAIVSVAVIIFIPNIVKKIQNGEWVTSREVSRASSAILQSINSFKTVKIAITGPSDKPFLDVLQLLPTSTSLEHLEISLEEKGKVTSEAIFGFFSTIPPQLKTLQLPTYADLDVDGNLSLYPKPPAETANIEPIVKNLIEHLKKDDSPLSTVHFSFSVGAHVPNPFSNINKGYLEALLCKVPNCDFNFFGFQFNRNPNPKKMAAYWKGVVQEQSAQVQLSTNPSGEGVIEWGFSSPSEADIQKISDWIHVTEIKTLFIQAPLEGALEISLLCRILDAVNKKNLESLATASFTVGNYLGRPCIVFSKNEPSLTGLSAGEQQGILADLINHLVPFIENGVERITFRGNLKGFEGSKECFSPAENVHFPVVNKSVGVKSTEVEIFGASHTYKKAPRE